MADILTMQLPEPLPPTVGEEKVSTVSYVHCHHSSVSVMMCAILGRR